MEPSSPSPYVSGPSQPHDYEFIMNPGKPPRPSLIPGNTSLPMRLLMGAGALFVLIIILVVIKGFFSGSSDFQPFISVAQQQQELINLTGGAAGEQDQGQVLSSTTKNFAVTANLSLTSAQAQLISYLQKNGVKLKPKLLNLKVSTTIDEQLTAATTASNYESTFREVMKSQLNSYQQNLKKTYAATKGPKGRQLLNDDYKGSQLLLQQLGVPVIN